MIERFKENIKKLNLFSDKEKLLLAVSGGMDSVVLCDLCKKAGFDFTIAHCNFQLRGEESERDEHFVKELGKKYGNEVLVKKFETEKYAAEHKISIQEAARDLRYGWFNECIESGNIAEKVLTAHHADDNIETLLMNFFRGTGLKGLTGIPLKTGYVRRPLLGVGREDLAAYAKENQLQWVEDSSNLSSDYTRNYFRNELIPGLSKVFPEVKKNLTGNIYRFMDIGKLFTLAVEDLRKKLVKQKGIEYHVPVKQLVGLKNRTIIYLIIRDFGFSEKQIDEVLKLTESQSGKYLLSPDGKHRIIRHRHWFIISPVNTVEVENIVLEENLSSFIFPGGELKIALRPFDKLRASQAQGPDNLQSGDKNKEMFNMDKIQFPLLLRKWKTGDYFYPLGMKKKKKLSRFFIDNKLSKSKKENIWVLEMDQKIIWVLGHRIDERFKITPATNKTLTITFIPAQ